MADEREVDVVVRVTVTGEDPECMSDDYAVDLVTQCLNGFGWGLARERAMDVAKVEVTCTSGGFDEVYNAEEDDEGEA